MKHPRQSPRPLRLLLPLLLLVAWAGGTAGARRYPEQDPDRAAYYYMEGTARLIQGDNAGAYYMMKKARALDTADVDIAGEFAEMSLSFCRTDSVEKEQYLKDLERRFYANTSDVVNGKTLMQVAHSMGKYHVTRDVYKALMEAYPARPEFTLEYSSARAADYMLENDSTAVDDAIAVLDRLEERIGPDIIVVYAKIRAIAFTADTAHLVEEIVRFPGTRPNDARVSLFTGELFGMVDMPDSAIHYIDRALELDPTMGDAYLVRVQYFLGQGDSTAYRREVVKVLDSEDLEFGSKLDILADYLRTLYADASQRDSIEQLLNRMLEMHPGEAELHNLYGAYLAAMEDNAAAAEQFGYAMDLAPEDDDYPRMRISCAIQAGDTVMAIETSRVAASRIHNPFYTISGSAFMDLGGDPEGALRFIDAYEEHPDDNRAAISLLCQQRGDILYRLGRIDEALDTYRRSIELNPGNTGSLNNLAYFMAENGDDLSKAEAYSYRAIQAEPDNPTFIDTYAWILYRQGDYEGARMRIDDVLRIYESPAAPSDTVEIALDTISFTGTITDVENEHDPSMVRNEEAVEKIEIDEAEEIVEADEAAAIPSKEIYDHAGDIYYMCGRVDEAVGFWQKALELDPGDKQIKKKVKNRRVAPPAPVKNKK